MSLRAALENRVKVRNLSRIQGNREPELASRGPADMAPETAPLLRGTRVRLSQYRKVNWLTADVSQTRGGMLQESPSRPQEHPGLDWRSAGKDVR